MAIEIREDYDRVSGGFAVMRLPQPLGDADPALSIVRLAGDPDKLGPGGWQAKSGIVQPREVTDGPNSSDLLLGPEICSHLIEDMEIEIAVPALGLKERVVWPFVAPSVHGDGGLGSMPGAAAGPSAAKPLIPQAAVQQTGHAPEADQPDDADTADVTPAPATQDAAAEPPAASGPSRTMLWVFLAAGLLLAGAVLIYFMFFTDPTEDTDNGADPVSTIEIEAEPIVAPDSDAQSQPVPEADTTDSLMDAARACQASECDATEFLDIGNRLVAINDQDNAFRVMDIAAREGSGQAALWLARAYDPMTFVAYAGLETADPGVAFNYYAQALASGEAAAAVAIESLCEALAAPFAPGSAFEALEPSQISLTRERNCE